MLLPWAAVAQRSAANRPGYDSGMSRTLAWARVMHPLPSAAVAVITVVIGVAVGLEPWRLALLGLTVFTNQLSVGSSNDWLDADRDRAVGRTDKPVALGVLAVGQVRTVALVLAAVSLAMSVPLGWGAAANLVFLAAGWSYNAFFKLGPLSVLPYAIGFGSIPLIATLSRAEPALASAWAILAGALLGISSHFANVLPDLDDDRRTGVNGLPHRLGRRTVGLVISVALVGASASIVLGPGPAPLAQYLALALSLVLAIVCAVLVVVRPVSRTIFVLTVVGALVNVVLLVTAGERLLA